MGTKKDEKDSLGSRMKRYEETAKSSLLCRTPVIIRLDGKAFHTYTRKFEKPFCFDLHDAMVESTKFLVENIQTAVFGYTQSDEISILLKDWTNNKTEPWFNNQVQKMASVSTSLLTAFFNDFVYKNAYLRENKVGNFALFDARVYNIPKGEVANYFIWRQQDATRNSINGLGQKFFSQKQLNGKKTNEVQDMLMTDGPGINWNYCETWQKRGSCVTTIASEHDRSAIVTDKDIPIFTADRAYIEDLL